MPAQATHPHRPGPRDIPPPPLTPTHMRVLSRCPDQRAHACERVARAGVACDRCVRVRALQRRRHARQRLGRRVLVQPQRVLRRAQAQALVRRLERGREPAHVHTHSNRHASERSRRVRRPGREREGGREVQRVRRPEREREGGKCSVCGALDGRGREKGSLLRATGTRVQRHTHAAAGNACRKKCGQYYAMSTANNTQCQWRTTRSVNRKQQATPLL
eukprot:353643-Chlamydomonas_euryale.AAC.9